MYDIDGLQLRISARAAMKALHRLQAGVIQRQVDLLADTLLNTNQHAQVGGEVLRARGYRTYQNRARRRPYP
jgi:hypothetical protein